MRLLSLALSQIAAGRDVEGLSRWGAAERLRQKVYGRWPWEPGRGGSDCRHAWLEADLEQEEKNSP